MKLKYSYNDSYYDSDCGTLKKYSVLQGGKFASIVKLVITMSVVGSGLLLLIR